MTKKIATLLMVGSLGALCAGLCACSQGTKIDEQYKLGNIISVKYDGSGGVVMNTPDVSIVDMFNPDKYAADENGYVHIKLREPTDEKRPHPGTNPISIVRRGYSLVGWYQTREEVKDGDGDVIDDNGNKLIYDELTDKYYTERTTSAGQIVREEATPKYKYADPWDFKTDTVDFKKGEEKLEMTLYAGWAELFSFDYYYKVDGNWECYATTTFDYQVASKENEKDDADPDKIVYDRVVVPDWSNETGRMEHKYSDVYTFPAVENKTFKAAYSDADCQNPITREAPLQHGGSMNYETATPVEPKQNVYVEFDEGNYYRISKAEQFASIADENGFYTVLSDELDFGCSLDPTDGELKFPVGGNAVRWPNKLMTAEFNGKIEGENGKRVVFKNVGAQYNSTANSVGLFGSISAEAVIRNIDFENVLFDIKSASGRGELNYGMFAGYVEDDAQIVGVTVGGEWRLWDISALEVSNAKFNLTANGNNAGVTKTQITLKACGDRTYGLGDNIFRFHVDFREGKTKVEQNGNLLLTIIPDSNKVERDFEGKYHEIVMEEI